MNRGLKTVALAGAALLVAGLIIAGISAALGAPYRYYWDGGLRAAGSRGTLVTEEFSGKFDSLDLKLGIYALEIEHTDGEYGVEYTYPANERAPKISLENGCLEFQSSQERNFNVVPGRNAVLDDKTWMIKIRYPRNKQLDQLEIDKSLGDLELNDIRAKSMDISLSCGSLKLFGCKADNAELKLSLGELRAEDFETKGLEASTQCGDMYLNGSFYGSTELKNSLGSTRFITTEPRESYAVDMDVNLGDITVDGVSAGRREFDKDREHRKNNLEANCSVGSIKADFGK